MIDGKIAVNLSATNRKMETSTTRKIVIFVKREPNIQVKNTEEWAPAGLQLMGGWFLSNKASAVICFI
jgi:hypothetical protein